MSRKKFSAFILVLSLFSLLFMPSVSLAEVNNLKALTFDVDVRPEYDDPRTLVIYQGDFINSGAETIKKDTPISFIIPKDAEIGMACELNAQGGHECQPYTTEDLGEGKVRLTWKITKDLAPNQKYPVFMEYYYDNKAVAPNKTFDLKFFPTSNIDQLNLSIIAPKTATNFVTNPATSNVSSNQEGLKTYRFAFNDQTPETPLNMNISYVKSDDKPTFDKPQTGNNTSNAVKSDGESWLTKSEVLIPIILALALIGLLVIYTLRKPQQQSKAQRNHPAKSSKAKSSGGANNKQNAEKKKIRQMLLDGKITEETYKQLLEDLKNQD